MVTLMRIVGILIGFVGIAALVVALLSALNGMWLPLMVMLPGIVAYAWIMRRGAK